MVWRRDSLDSSTPPIPRGANRSQRIRWRRLCGWLWTERVFGRFDPKVNQGSSLRASGCAINKFSAESNGSNGPANLVIESRKAGNGLIWGFDYLIPADHLMRLVFVLWNKGIPTVEPGLSGYFKAGHQPALFKGDFGGTYWSCGPNVSDTRQGNVVNWNLMLCDNRMGSAWISNQPPLRTLEAPSRSILHSGRQLAIRLAQSDHAASAPGEWSGVEIRWILQPLQSPAVQSDPSEVVTTNYMAGFGLSDMSKASILKLIQELPCESPEIE